VSQINKDQEKDLNKLEGDAAKAEFVPTSTTAPVNEKPPTQAAMQLAGYVVMGAAIACNILAVKRGKHWLLSEPEQQQLHGAIARVAEKYITIDLNNPLYALGAVLGAIMVPRLAVEFMSGEKTINGGPDGDQPEHQVAE
jgi:hypothetical protein